ncbi:MAG TPA: hypothetical protein VFB16_07005 [Bauldia sp.]|nr:hypothetical protein [Bauldia sp.]
MGRIFNGILLAAMIVGAVLTYNMKHGAEVEADKVAQLNAEIGREKETIALLRAEWSKLSQPSRLQELIARYPDHFKLAPFTASQFATIDEVPMKPVSPGDLLAKKIAASE